MIKMILVAGFPNGYLSILLSPSLVAFGLLIACPCSFICLTGFLSQAGAFICATTSSPAFWRGFFVRGKVACPVTIHGTARRKNAQKKDRELRYPILFIVNHARVVNLILCHYMNYFTYTGTMPKHYLIVQRIHTPTTLVQKFTLRTDGYGFYSEYAGCNI